VSLALALAQSLALALALALALGRQRGLKVGKEKGETYQPVYSHRPNLSTPTTSIGRWSFQGYLA